MSLTSNYFEKMSFNNKILEMYEELNVELTSNIINRLKENSNLSEFTKSQLKILLERNGEEIFLESLEKTNSLSIKRKNELKNIFTQLAKDDMKVYKRLFVYKNKEFKISDNQYKILNNAIKITDGQLKNFTKTIAYASQEDYVNAVDKMYLQVATMGMDFDTAFKNTASVLAEKGISLKDSIGRNRSIEASVRQNLLYAIRDTTRNFNKELGKFLGCDGVQINISPNCRPTHAIINGQIFSNKRWQEHSHLLEDYNCQHYEEPVIMDIEENKYSQEEIDEANNRTVNYKGEEIPYYEATQKQRYYERQVRNAKKEYAIAENSGIDTSRANQHIKNSQRNLRNYCKETGLTRDYDREFYAGYSRNIKTKVSGLSSSNKITFENHKKPILLEKMDNLTSKNILSKLKYYENNIKSAKIENAIVITKIGEVYQCFGSATNVWPNADLGEKLIGASVTHNHPIKESSYSFSNSDIELFEKYQLERLRGIDEKYTYELDRSKKAILSSPTFADLIEDNSLFHIENIDYAIKNNIYYMRWKND